MITFQQFGLDKKTFKKKYDYLRDLRHTTKPSEFISILKLEFGDGLLEELRQLSIKLVGSAKGCRPTVREIYDFLYPKEIHTCATCNCEIRKFNSKYYAKFCSTSCVTRNPGIIEKRAQTSLRKYGTRNPNSLPEIKEKIASSTFSRYGVRNASQSSVVQKKKEETSLVRYGETHWSKTAEGKKHLSLNNPMSTAVGLEHYQNCIELKYGPGIYSPLLLESVQTKIKEGNLIKFGHENPFGSKQVQDKIEETFIKKYGETHFMKTEEYREWFSKNNPYTLSENCGTRKYGRKYKICIDNTDYVVQGYEEVILRKLLANSTVETVCMGKELPRITYSLEDGDHTYYPDMGVISTSGQRYVVEVKSLWTLCYPSIEINMTKFRAATKYCDEKGYIFRLIISDGKKFYKHVDSPTSLRKISKDAGIKFSFVA